MPAEVPYQLYWVTRNYTTPTSYFLTPAHSCKSDLEVQISTAHTKLVRCFNGGKKDTNVPEYNVAANTGPLQTHL